MPLDEELRQVRTLAQRVAQSHGLDLFDVQLRRESSGLVLRVFIDRPAAQTDTTERRPPDQVEDSVSVDDCQRVSHDLSTVLDVEDVLEQAYTLEVSSPGLDRPLRDATDYRRFSGRLARIVVSEAIGGQKQFSGRLRGVENADVLLEDSAQRVHRIPLSVVSRARLEVEF